MLYRTVFGLSHCSDTGLVKVASAQMPVLKVSQHNIETREVTWEVLNHV